MLNKPFPKSYVISKGQHWGIEYMRNSSPIGLVRKLIVTLLLATFASHTCLGEAAASADTASAGTTHVNGTTTPNGSPPPAASTGTNGSAARPGADPVTTPPSTSTTGTTATPATPATTTKAATPSTTAATLFDRSLALFQARAQKVSPSDYSFVILGDSRDNDPVFVQILELAASLDPLFIVHGGDYSSRGRVADTVAFLKILKETVPRIPVFVVPGNHETKGVFAKYVGPSRFTLESDRLGLTFVVLDNSDYVLKKGDLDYLRETLSTAQDASFVMMHVPPKTERWSWHTFSEGAEDLRRVVSAAKPDALFFSHVHLFDRQSFGGVPAFITGGAGAPLVWFGFPGTSVFHVLVVRVQGEKVTVTKVDLPLS